ncbi:MAG: flagellar assembly protein FliW [Gammaproteobacteria bacterium]|nr:flagellar assembly protein FliW [Gammaproteobacteria bacterium]MBU1980310.1 flagellar assembly protein FliW [Gammaproteobacteria bacterium]
MKFHSIQFGTQEIDPESILTFPKGMPGFENCTRYKLFHEDKEQPVVHWLQSIDDPSVAFSVVDPAVFGLNYEFVLSDEEEQLLKMESVDDIAVFLIAYKQQPDAGSKTNINANINGPIVLNTRARIGMQKVLVGLQADITLKSKKPAA